MSIRIELPSSISSKVGSSYFVAKANVPAAALRELADSRRDVQGYLFNSRGDLRDSIAFFTGNEYVSSNQQFADGTVVEMILQSSGG